MSQTLELGRVTPSSATQDVATNHTSLILTGVDDANNAHATTAPPGEHRPKEPPRPTSAAIALTMMSLCLSCLLSALDLTIVTPAIPSIVSAFQSSSGYIWVGSAYTLAHAAITPVWGAVSDIWGRKPIILIAMTVFLGGSLVCALARHMETLIVGRALQGLGGSGMGTMVNIVVCDLFSLRDRGLYLAITSLVWAVGSAVGPVLGGVFTTRLSWRWCFWINLPVGAVSFLVLLFFMKVPNPRTPIAAGLKVIDWTGSVLIIGGSLMVLLALDFGDVVYSWSSATVICLLVFGTAVMGLFIVNEWKMAKNPIIPLWLFSSPSKAAPYVVFACNSYVFIGQAYYLPLYAQSVLAASALTSGLYLLPLIVSCSLVAAATGVFIQQTGKYLPVMYLAQGFLVLGSGLLVSLDFESNITKLVIFQILVGIGVGMNIDAPILAAQAATSVRDTAAVTATMGFVRSLSTAVSVVVGGVVFQNEMNAKNDGLASSLGENSALARQFNGDLAASSVEDIGTSGLSGEQETVVRKTYFEALRIVWVMYVVFAGLATILNLFVRAHKLRDENEGAVLGADRARPQAPSRNEVEGMELQVGRGNCH
ncbi:Putative MFS transporter (Fragment) [Aspergillus calidoustus]|uniref:Putative MFS transporter n=1 Tax=Aspergillus calidoustus TaxID=454130 RepID=A0A0U4ZMT8_ASPCI